MENKKFTRNVLFSNFEVYIIILSAKLKNAVKKTVKDNS